MVNQSLMGTVRQLPSPFLSAVVQMCVGLLQQVIAASAAAGIPLSGENALQRYDQQAFDRIAESAVGQSARAGRLQQLTFLRMGDLMFDNWGAFTQLLQRLHCVPQFPQQLYNWH